MGSKQRVAAAGAIVAATLLAGCHTPSAPETGVATIHPGMVSTRPAVSRTVVLLGAGDEFSGASYAAYLAYLDGTTGAAAVAGAETARPFD